MVAQVAEVGRIHEPVGIVVGRGHVVGEGSTHGDLDTLKSVHDQQSKRAVEHVQVEHVVERGPFPHLVLCAALLEWDRVWRESVIADVADIPGGAVSIRDL